MTNGLFEELDLDYDPFQAQLRLPLPGGEVLFGKILEIRRRVRGNEHRDTLQSMISLALVHLTRTEYDRAEPLLVNVVAVRQRLLGEDHPDTVIAMYLLSGMYSDQHRYLEAEPLLRKVQEITRRVLGAQNRSTLLMTSNLAALYREQGKYDLAEQLYVQVLEQSRRTLGDEHPDTLKTMEDLGKLYRIQGRHELAEPLFSELLEVRRLVRRLGRGIENRDFTTLFDQQLALILSTLGLNKLLLKKYGEAEPLLRECLTISKQLLPDDWSTFETKSLLGTALLNQKKYADAESLLLAGYDGMKQREKTIPSQDRSHITETLDRLIQLYTETNKPDDVKKWQAEKARLVK